MARSIAQVQAHLEACRLQQIVWEQAVAHLNTYVDLEAREAQSRMLTEHCVTKEVPQEVITQVVQEIEEEKLHPLKREIDSLVNLKVVETNDGDQEKDAGTPTQTPVKKVQKGVRVVAGPARAAGNKPA